MKIDKIALYNTNFNGRNANLKQADKILRKINKEFPSSSPWHADYRATKADRISEDQIATMWTTVKLNAFRESQESVVNKNLYKYATCLIEGTKRYKVANCKELAELAFLIAKVNGIDNCYCANLYLKNYKTKKNIDIEHSITLINHTSYKNTKLADPYYDDIPSHTDLQEPNDKTIVVDPLFGIVDYWKNAKKIYLNNGFITPKPNDELTVFIRKPILESDNDIKKLQVNYPFMFLNNSSDSDTKNKFDFRATDLALELYKNSTSSLNIINYPPAKIIEETNSNKKTSSLTEIFRNLCKIK